MDKRKAGMIATVTTSVLCGGTGLVLMCLGAFALFSAQLPENLEANGGDPTGMSTGSIMLLCFSVFLIAIPVVVGILTLRKRAVKPYKTDPSIDIDEPLPPTS